MQHIDTIADRDEVLFTFQPGSIIVEEIIAQLYSWGGSEGPSAVAPTPHQKV
jgi:hypothetical protein